MTTVPIVFSTDHNFIIPTCVAISSLLKSAEDKEKYDIFVLADDDVTQEDKELLMKEKDGISHSKITFLFPAAQFKEAYEIREIKRATYFKLSIPWLLKEYDYVIYADSDIIFKKGLEEIYNANKTGDFYIAGVNLSKYTQLHYLKDYIEKLGLDSKFYINGGFIIFNCEKIRKDKNEKSLLTLCSHKYDFQDQDILNIVFKNGIKLLPAAYNRDVKYCDDLNLDDLYVLHYLGIKPWIAFTHRWIDWWECYKSSKNFNKGLLNKATRNILMLQGESIKEVKNNQSDFVKLSRIFSKKIPLLNNVASFFFKTYGRIKR